MTHDPSKGVDANKWILVNAGTGFQEKLMIQNQEERYEHSLIA